MVTVPDDLSHLSAAERESLVAIVDGRTKREIAAFRRCSLNAAKKVRRKALAKLSPSARATLDQFRADKSPPQIVRPASYRETFAAA